MDLTIVLIFHDWQKTIAYHQIKTGHKLSPRINLRMFPSNCRHVKSFDGHSLNACTFFVCYTPSNAYKGTPKQNSSPRLSIKEEKTHPHELLSN